MAGVASLKEDFLVFEGVSKRFGSLKAVDNVSLAIRQGEIHSLLGPSGCGKTTLLRMVAGFERPDSGRVYLNGQDITDLPPNKRQVNTIFQNYALFPHLTVRQNIGFGLKIARRSKAEIRDEVEKMLELIQLQEHGDKHPAQLSGGQKQRVAIARALINKPQVLLLDEPLAALDLKLRQRMLVELDAIHDEVGITFVFVTHDQGEAMSLSDRISVMNRGRVEQMGKPTEIYEAPRTSFVAAFIGDTNFLEARVTRLLEAPYCAVEVSGLAELEVDYQAPVREGALIYISVRPEKFRVSRVRPEPEKHVNVLPGKIEDVIYFGSHTRYWVRCGEYRIAALEPHDRFVEGEELAKWGDEVWLSFHGYDGYILDRYEEKDEALLSLAEESN